MSLRNELSRFFGRDRIASRTPGERIVAGMATLVKRHDTFRRALASILRQVDRLYVYLDGHRDMPELVRGDPRVTAVLSRDMPGLHANGKLLGLALEPGDFTFVSVDDDFHYSPDFIGHLRTGLARYCDHAIVGYHGIMLRRPLTGYNKDKSTIPYTSRPLEDRPVDAIGTGAAMFLSSSLRFDVRAWPYINMVDLGLAVEAAHVKLPMISIARRKRYLWPIENDQPDSIAAGLRRDDSRQTALAKELLRLQMPTDE
jgi:hypothetical protein